MVDFHANAVRAVERCRALARHTEEPGFTTRTFLSEPMRQVHKDVAGWMQMAGMTAWVDAAGNLRGAYPGNSAGTGDEDAPVLYVGSHLDTVPHAGAFDGVLGVVLGVELVELLGGRRAQFGIEVLGFSEEEGVRFGFPFIGSRAFAGELDPAWLSREDPAGISVRGAVVAFGLNPEELPLAVATSPSVGYLEIHIEQGPVLESLHFPLGVVETIAGQSRARVAFIGQAGHAGTTPMALRRDALAGAAEWILQVESSAREAGNLVATVGHLEAQPGASNVIPGRVSTTLDVRHPDDAVRRDATAALIARAQEIAARRGLEVTAEHLLDQPAVPMHGALTDTLARSLESCGHTPHRMVSGAGHDAMVVGRRMPAAMLFLRSPSGLSHHPDEAVLVEDVAAALKTAAHFLDELEGWA